MLGHTVLTHGVIMFRLQSRFRQRRRNRGLGQGLVEFALILPILMLFFVTVLDGGRIAAAQIALANAAREAAFQAAVTPTDFNASNPCPADGSSNKIWCRITLESTGWTPIRTSAGSDACPAASCS